MTKGMLRDAARRILDESPDAPVRVRLLRDVLQRPADDPELQSAVAALDDSPKVQVLAQEQRADGSWGRLHTVDYAAKQKIPTTALGVEPAVELGLPAEHPALRKVRGYLEGILAGRAKVPNRAEKHENWPTGVSMFAASPLCRFAPESPALDQTRGFWSAVLRRSFARGRYDQQAELKTHQDLLGRSGEPGWLRLHSMHAVAILGSRAAELPAAVQRAYVRWLWHDCPKGLIYFDVPFQRPLNELRGYALHGWLTSLELISGFPCSRRLARPALAELDPKQAKNNAPPPGCNRGEVGAKRRWLAAAAARIRGAGLSVGHGVSPRGLRVAADRGVRTPTS